MNLVSVMPVAGRWRRWAQRACWLVWPARWSEVGVAVRDGAVLLAQTVVELLAGGLRGG